SEAALARAWALRRLAENPALKQTNQLSPEAKARLAAMLENHRTGLGEQMRELRGGLEPCLTFVAGAQASGREARVEQAADWAGAALTVFQSVSQLDRLLHGMFSPSGSASEPAATAREVLAEFADLETALRLLESQSGRIATDK